MRPLNAVEEQALALLKAANGSLNLKQIGQRMESTTAHDLKVALDTLTLRDLVERVDTGRDVTFTAVAPSAPPALKAAAPSVSSEAHAMRASGVGEQNRERVLRFLQAADPKPCFGREIFDALGINQSAFSIAVRALEAAGQVVRVRSRSNAPLYALSKPAAATPTGVVISAGAEPQPACTAAGAADDGQRNDTPESAAPPSAAAPATDELLTWHSQRAEQEARRRTPAFALPDAMRNTGDEGAEQIGIAGSVLIDTASFALWSDGRLEIDAGSDHVTLSQPATRALLDYLDRVCAIEQH